LTCKKQLWLAWWVGGRGQEFQVQDGINTNVHSRA
jgi:hypothetical protein